MENVNYGEAIEAMRNGECVTRKSWNDKNMFVCKQIPAFITKDIIGKMSSLPESAKDIILEKLESISYENQMILVKSNGVISNWFATGSDTFADDWEIL